MRSTEIRRHPARRADRLQHRRAAAMADDRAAHAQGLDRTEGGRWTEDRRASGARIRSPRRASRRTRSISQLLEDWLRATDPMNCSTSRRRCSTSSLALAPTGAHGGMGANPHANGGLLRDPAICPIGARHAGARRPGGATAESTRVHGRVPARRYAAATPRRRISASSVRTRPRRTGWRTCSR